MTRDEGAERKLFRTLYRMIFMVIWMGVAMKMTATPISVEQFLGGVLRSSCA